MGQLLNVKRTHKITYSGVSIMSNSQYTFAINVATKAIVKAWLNHIKKKLWECADFMPLRWIEPQE